jgi:cytochrome c oxidase subunit 4
MNSDAIIPVRTYVLVFLGLIMLTITTTAVAFVDLGGQWNTAAALAIAVIKALLVILFFMHVLYSRPLTWVFVSAGFFWLLILFTLTLADYFMRNIGGAPLRSAAPAAQAAPRQTREITPRALSTSEPRATQRTATVREKRSE